MQYNDKLIKFEQISEISSQLASFPKVRKILLKKQRSFCLFPGLVAEGRDMGTVVFPNATLKFFLDATLEVRVYRRMLELKKNNCYVDFKTLLNKMNNRDKRDQNRLISPLCIAKNAIILDSTYMSLSEVIRIFMKYITKNIEK